ncbi:NusG domain II-containing protein [Romboutsia lituseburensis]|uniref:NusG domain II-containing protein n=1 Tax=Romboutsia lituseburensis TaxID=1537 RepID=UPI00215ADC89|nr:NusG domain II-containing protein [Romboutsia lituseburensis]MCR8746309.1 NusG domain II-containing protein [Romboutsia lituseburensis]
MKSFKKLDFIIIVLLFVLSFTPNIIFSKSRFNSNKLVYASIKVDGKLYDNIPLSTNNGEKKFNIKSSGGNNSILIKDNTIKVISADCKDDLCIKQGEISKVGENIICLPHKLIIEIKGDEKDSSSDMILSH